MSVPEAIALVRANSLQKSYGTGRTAVEALRDVDVEIRDGEAVALMGPSGCGKSTLLRVIGLIHTPSSGALTVDGRESPTGRNARARLRNSFFGYLHQEFALIDNLTAAQNVAIPMEYARPPIKRQTRKLSSRTMLSRLGLDWAADRRADELSGGERQRVALARALINSPRIVLADEPTGALDSTTGSQILDVLLTMSQSGTALLIATHDPAVADRCHRVISMRDGRIVST